ncbi:femAB family protein [Marine Group I thaumarchaeote SCGC AAA799-P11]|uniref:FemAB family protein n=1 Tax=Marine Group I thaumarchaeote SCGC AAA799-P11 TaxID=1502295 RepID=A0A087RZ90_9ARCH|nr:femAB family protein [Marine Group I thaumarchaeote SCGC AAA799-P11]
MNYMLNFEISQNPPSNWNKFFLDVGYGIFSQTVEYSKYVEKWIGWEPFFVQIMDNDDHVLLQNLIFRYNPGISKVPSVAQKFYKKFKKSYRWTYGPISLNENAIIAFFEYFKNTKKHIHGTTHPLLFSPKLQNMEKWSTSLIDLRNSKEVLEQNLDKHSCKKNIKRSIERHVKVENISKKNFVDYFELLSTFRKETEHVEPNYEELKDFWELLQPIGFDGFLAYKDEIPVGGLTFGYFNNHIIEVGVARSKIDYTEKLYSQDLIKWKIIEWGVDHKMNYFDLAGYNPDPQNTKEMGIKKYKEKWGGKHFDYWLVRN